MKQRLVGAALLISLGVIIIPMLLDHPRIPEPMVGIGGIPPKPEREPDPKIIPLEEEQLSPDTAGQLQAWDPNIGSPPESKPAGNGTGSKLGSSAGPSPRLGAEGARGPASAPGPKPGESKPARAAPTGSSRADPHAATWVVQLGSFSGERNAKALETRLRNQGYGAYVDKLPVKRGTMFRVRVGPAASRSQATELQARLQKDSNLRGMVVRYP